MIGITRHNYYFNEIIYLNLEGNNNDIIILYYTLFSLLVIDIIGDRPTKSDAHGGILKLPCRSSAS